VKAFLDTHVAVALYRNDDAFFSRRAADALERSALFVSPMVNLEIAFLHAIGRLRDPPSVILPWLREWRGVLVSHDDLHDVVEEAMAIDWTRDPFDLVIASTALLHKAPLVTRDERMREHLRQAVW
jgi:PIN domain nuclease of toxin-antitoxin system